MFMIVRAVFFIGVVLLLTPHEPDIGLGRPGAGTSLPSPAMLMSASGLSRMPACAFPACAGALASLLQTQSGSDRLAQMKAEIAADLKTRRTS